MVRADPMTGDIAICLRPAPYQMCLHCLMQDINSSFLSVLDSCYNS